MSIFDCEIFEEIIHNVKNFTNYNIFMDFVKKIYKIIHEKFHIFSLPFHLLDENIQNMFPEQKSAHLSYLFSRDFYLPAKSQYRQQNFHTIQY